MPRVYCEAPLAEGAIVDLPAGATRHVQVLRMQPGDALTLFDGRGGQWQAQIHAMGRSSASAHVLMHEPLEREAAHDVVLAVGMPANERMDWLVEKATELGVRAIQPLVTQRCVLRLSGERAERKAAHWRAVAIAACEQCGRNRLPAVLSPLPLDRWLAGLDTEAPRDAAHAGMRLLLTPGPGERIGGGSAIVLSGPEGGLTPEEEAAARAVGFVGVNLGPRILRAETAPLAALTILTLLP